MCPQGARHSYAGMMGRDVANPTGILLCASNMLKHMHLEFHGSLIQDAVEKVIRTGKVGACYDAVLDVSWNNCLLGSASLDAYSLTLNIILMS